jgi:hypothetical protein
MVKDLAVAPAGLPSSAASLLPARSDAVALAD